jgi:hypothetical protein
MVRPERVELSTFSLGMKCSIHLSYGRTSGIIADFLPSFMEHLAASSRVLLAIKGISERRLLFRSPVLMFLSLLDLFPRAM